MPKLIPQEDFDHLTDLARALVERSREIAESQSDFPGDAPDDQVAAAIEVQAFSAAMMALATASPLMPTPLFIAMGSAIGVILAQQMDPHAVLLGQLREQTRSTYNDVVEAQRPQGTA